MEMVTVIDCFTHIDLQDDVTGDKDCLEFPKNRIVVFCSYDKGTRVFVCLPIHFHPIGSK